MISVDDAVAAIAAAEEAVRLARRDLYLIQEFCPHRQWKDIGEDPDGLPFEECEHCRKIRMKQNET